MVRSLNRKWIIEHRCPQCGAPVTLEETDRIFACSFCRVKLYIAAGDYLRYCLVPPNTTHDNIVFVPYWRFRGMVFSCRHNEINCRVIDTTSPAAQLSFLPLSLGFKPQALKLQFVRSETSARFLSRQVPFDDVFSGVEKQTKKMSASYSEFIGETVSLIYAPFYYKNNLLYDAIADQPVKEIMGDSVEKDLSFDSHADWNVKFVPTLCPYCGWDLSGEKESCVLFCNNCDSAWEFLAGGFKKLEYGAVSGDNTDILYLPFWRMKADIEGAMLKSYADLIRFVNLPRAIFKGCEESGIYFWSPAFKVNPKLFLRIAGQLTVFQPDEKPQKTQGNFSAYPVTLPAREAAETVAITLAHIASDKKKMFSTLSEIKIELKEYFLTYLPFTVRANELVQCQMQFSINRNALTLGRSI